MNSQNQISIRTEKFHRPQILLVDDQVADLYLLNSVFDFLHCQVDRAMDGGEAVLKLQMKDYDLVVLDWLMPIKGGKDVIQIMDRKMKRNESSHRPLVINTGLSGEKIDLPTSRYFQLVDVWQKNSSLSQMIKRADTLVSRLRRTA